MQNTKKAFLSLSYEYIRIASQIHWIGFSWLQKAIKNAKRYDVRLGQKSSGSHAKKIIPLLNSYPKRCYYLIIWRF